MAPKKTITPEVTITSTTAELTPEEVVADIPEDIDTYKVEAEEDAIAEQEQEDMKEVDKMCKEETAQEIIDDIVEDSKEFIEEVLEDGEKLAKTVGLNILRVMDRTTRQVIEIDGDVETDYKSKYLHRSGNEFIS